MNFTTENYYLHLTHTTQLDCQGEHNEHFEVNSELKIKTQGIRKSMADKVPALKAADPVLIPDTPCGTP